MAESAAAKVSSIFIYPIKSCRGISVSEAPLLSTGFRWDRQWVVANSKGRACTQRVDPKLALVKVELPQDAFAVGWKPNKGSHLGALSSMNSGPYGTFIGVYDGHGGPETSRFVNENLFANLKRFASEDQDMSANVIMI
ncbi:putative molybdenum cofactor sulfurtransferase [Helianthus anomalus]